RRTAGQSRVPVRGSGGSRGLLKDRANFGKDLAASAAPAVVVGYVGLLPQARQAVFVALLGHRTVVDLLPQVALCGQLLDRFAARGAQGIGVGDAGAGVVAGAGESVPELLPGLAAGALCQRAVQVVLGLLPVSL